MLLGRLLSPLSDTSALRELSSGRFHYSAPPQWNFQDLPFDSPASRRRLCSRLEITALQGRRSRGAAPLNNCIVSPAPPTPPAGDFDFNRQTPFTPCRIDFDVHCRRLRISEVVWKRSTMGFPQGSILDPKLWKSFLDDSFRFPFPVGVKVMVYADELTVLVEGSSRSESER
ncbi:hypothetical protein EVAR_47486_1 [Eumeta japonica]|uniref:Reverse transcriptase domain-containing protein n=1 Tax=Eumeta variegata TaxID=151549 RepID=A0A4C1XBH3_EUMVA|nr:hypothetical protein EVAR_47486_1 [Eumeta japonica]